MNENNKELKKAQDMLLSDKYSLLFENVDINSVLNKVEVCDSYQTYLMKQKDKNKIAILPGASSNRIINEVLKHESLNIYSGRKIEFAKDKILNSSNFSFLPKEKIEESFKKIYICKDDKEFYSLYGGNSKGEMIEGFNRNGISYLKNDMTPHVIIHEVLHSLSSTFDNEGHRINNGIRGNKNSQDFGNSLNEGLTDFIAKKISNEESQHYQRERTFFENFSPLMQKYYGDENILEKMYISNNDKLLKSFFDKNSKILDGLALYNKFLFIDDKTFGKVFNEVSKNVERKIKKDEFKKNHPKFSKYLRKVKNIFLKDKNEYLPLNQPSQENLNKDCFEKNLRKLTFCEEEIALQDREKINIERKTLIQEKSELNEEIER